MKRSLIIMIMALAIIVAQGIDTYAQRLLKKLYDDKETVRGTKKEEKKVVVATTSNENEYYYKDNSGMFPATGRAYVQYYYWPDKITLIANSRVTADVYLAGIDTMKYHYKEDYYWEVYDRFMINKATLYYRKVGTAPNGMHIVVLYAKTGGYTVNVNEWINKWCRVNFDPTPPKHSSPVWLYKGKWTVNQWGGHPQWQKKGGAPAAKPKAEGEAEAPAAAPVKKAAPAKKGKKK